MSEKKLRGCFCCCEKTFLSFSFAIVILFFSFSSIGQVITAVPVKWWLSSTPQNGPGPGQSYGSPQAACTAAIKSESSGPGWTSTCAFTGELTKTPIPAQYSPDIGAGWHCTGTCTTIDRRGSAPVTNTWTQTMTSAQPSLHCPPGFMLSSSDVDGYRCVLPVCDDDCSNKKNGTHRGNPINLANGNKTQRESDYQYDDLEFSRSYNSSGIAPGSIATNYYYSDVDFQNETNPDRRARGWIPINCKVGVGLCDQPTNPVIEGDLGKSALGASWRSNFDKKLRFVQATPKNIVTIINAGKRVQEFVQNGNTWLADRNVAGAKLEEIIDVNGNRSGWKHTTLGDGSESYNILGNLVSIQSRSGRVLTLTYDAANRLIRVADQFGRQLNFTHDDAGRIKTLIDPANAVYSYLYDTFGNLTSVTFPDQSVREYRYADPRHPSALTGIVDEKGVLFATWVYDEKGRAVSSVHAGDVERVKVAYSANKAVATEASGSVHNYDFGRQNNATVLYSVSDMCGPSCTRSRQFEYDLNGNVTNEYEYNGVRTNYAFDLNRNLETKRVEASGKPEAKTISTQWHTTYRIPVQIDEPLRRTTFTHDANGNVLTKTEQATTDTNGSQGAAATVVGAAKVWTYTYNSFGQVLTAKGPRTDINDLTSYVYDNQGNLTSVTNPAGHATSMSNYDAHGRVGLITDPNGVTTALTYHPRGWLLSRAVTADGVTETTSYTYDGVGQMTQVTLPDNSVITYTYDDAHRLTKVSDHLGNSITYTLDNMGNRIKEEVKDASGTLTQQVTRVYDVLDRIKEVTGGVQ